MIFPDIFLMDGPIIDIGPGGTGSGELSVSLKRLIRLLETTFDTRLRVNNTALLNSSAEGKYQALAQALQDTPNLENHGLLVLHSNREMLSTAKRLGSEWVRRITQSDPFVFDHRRVLFVGSTQRLSATGSDASLMIASALSVFPYMCLGVNIMASNGRRVFHNRLARCDEASGRIIELPYP